MPLLVSAYFSEHDSLYYVFYTYLEKEKKKDAYPNLVRVA